MYMYNIIASSVMNDMTLFSMQHYAKSWDPVQVKASSENFRDKKFIWLENIK